MADSPQKFTIGRDKSCDIAIADDSVSRVHAEIGILPDGKLSVTDRGSSNGTALIRQGKAQPVTRETVVAASDRVRFGTVELAVHELTDAIRRKYPAAASAAGGQRRPADPAARPDRPVRCACGAIKPANQRCPACGE
jgi:pSer/pThr/pTyr-binding forkhead associated (FHA) protein